MTQPRDRARLRRLSTRRPGAPAGVLLAGILQAALLAAACGPAPTAAPTTVASLPGPTATALAASPSAGASATAEASPVDTGPTAAACTAADVKVSHGLVEGTAGSRNTEVVLVAAMPCAVPAWPAFGIRDARGAALIAGASEGPGILTLFPNASYVSDARVANWCGLDPAFPLTLELRLGDEAIPVTGGPFPDEGDMPPCTGGTSPTLNGTAWTPSS